jgi:hypothetical protein
VPEKTRSIPFHGFLNAIIPRRPSGSRHYFIDQSTTRIKKMQTFIAIFETAAIERVRANRCRRLFTLKEEEAAAWYAAI